MMTPDPKSDRGETRQLTVPQALLIVAGTLDDLEATNLELQERASALAEKRDGSLIEGLQILDHQAQVLRDLATTLRRLAKLAADGGGIAEVDEASLFKLDATRNSRVLNKGTDAGDTSRPEDIWL